jgi:lysophospholipase L1-like esterase
MQKTYTLSIFAFLMLWGRLASAAITVTSLSVYSGPSGTAVTVTGTGFDAAVANNAVYFGAAKAVISAATTTTLSVTVPAGATYCQVSVSNIITRLVAYSALPFEPTYSGRSGIAAGDIEAPVNFNTGSNPMASAIADFDGDGLEDIAVVNSTSNTISIFQSKANGSITSNSFVRTDVSVPYSPTAIVAADLNGDGKIDLALVYQNGGTMSAFPNQSTGPGSIAFTSRGDFACSSPGAFAIAAADIQKDGKVDLIIANYTTNSISIFRNQIGTTGNGVSFAARVDFATGKNPNSIVVADVDNDGKPEVITGNFTDNSISIFKNNSTPSTINSSTLGAKSDVSMTGRVTSVFSSFIDNDAYPDLVIAVHSPATSSNKISVMRNIMTAPGAVSGASFTLAADNISTGSEPVAVGIGDIDGDGNPDIVAADYNSKTVSVFRNTSSGTTISTATISAKVDFATGNAPRGLSVNDLDGDGRPEIVVTNDLDNSLSVLHNYNNASVPGPVFAESTASVSLGSFINADIYDSEWEQDPAPGFTSATYSGANITGGTNKGRFVYFSTMGSVTPMNRVKGNVTFSASGTGTIEVRIIPTWNPTLVESSKTFTLNAAMTDYGWDFGTIYPQLEYYLAVIFPAGTTAQFKKNFSLSLQQGNMNGNFTRYRADLTSLIGNTETSWYGWNDQANAARKKYIQHSAYSRMRFTTTATQILLEYVRDLYDGRVSNLFPAYQVMNGADWAVNGSVVSGMHAIDSAIRVTPGKVYTISGLHTYYAPTYVWFNKGVAIAAPATMSNVSPGTTANPVYSITAPAGATNLAIMVQKISDPANYYSPVNDTYFAYTNCMVQEGAVGTVTPYDGTIPSATYLNYSGHTPVRISGPAIFVNGKLYNYYAVEGSDQAKTVQYVSAVLPTGTKTVEVMMPGQGTYSPFDPSVRRSGTYLRAVYFPAATTTELPSTTVTTGSALFIHDSILSGFNIGSNAQNNVWMMKTQRDSTYGFTGEIFSEGYAGRILHTDTQTPTLLEAFAQKLNNFHVSKYWFQIGVNDYGFDTPLPNFYTEYKTLVDRLKALGTTSTKIYIQSTGPEVFEGSNSETYSDDGLSTTGPVANDFRDIQRAIANNRSFCEYVDFEKLFDKTPVNLSDGIHPTDAGNIAYANGIKYNSTFLGKTQPSATLSFYSRDNTYSLRPLTKAISGISVVSAIGGKLPYSFALTTGSMPAGLTLNADGVISGTPTVSGTFTLSIKVTDANTANVTRNYTLIINPSPVVAAAPLFLKGATTNTAWSKTVKGVGGFGKYTLSASGLSSGFTFSPTTGVVSGTPTTSFTFTVNATDHYGFTGQTAYSVPVGSGTPAVLSAVFSTITTLSGNNVVVTGKLNDYYNENLMMGVGAIVTQGSTNTFYQGGIITMASGTTTGQPFIVATVNPALGAVTKVQLAVYTSATTLTQVNTNDTANLTFASGPVTNFP